MTSTTRSSPLTSERNSKGTILTAIRTYTLNRFGAEGWRRVLARLEHADRIAVEGLVAVGWYPTRQTLAVLDAFAATFQPEDPSVLTDYGRKAAESDLTIFHRVFLRMANPAFVLEKTTEYWGRFHTHGRWSHVERHTRGASSSLADFAGNVTYCQCLVPYMQRLFELVGAREVVVTHPACSHRGDAGCTFITSWA